MAFLTGIRLPPDIERGVTGGPRFNTTVLPLDSGYEQRNVNWSQVRGEWDAGYGLMYKFNDGDLTKADLNVVLSIFYICQGKANSFRFKDWADFEIGYEDGSEVGVSAQFLAYGDGTTKAFSAFKRYTIGNFAYDRTITKLVNGTVKVYLEGVLLTEGVDYTVNYDTGVITFTVAPAATGGSGPLGEEVVTFRAEFDVHVRLDTDDLKLSMEIFNAGSWPNIPLVELRGA